MPPHMTGQLVLLCVWEATVPFDMGYSIRLLEYPHGMVADFD